MINLFEIIYAMVSGFVAAALVSEIYRIAAGRKAGFCQLVETRWQAIQIIFLSLFAGPWMLASATIESRAENNISSRMNILGLSIACLWSLCFGVVIISIFENI